MYEIIRGPMAWLAFCVFIVGMAFQIVQFFRFTRSNPRIRPLVNRGDAGSQTSTTRKGKWIAKLAAWRVTLWGAHPLMALCTTVFHLCIFIVPIFQLHHNSIMEQLWGFSFCPRVLSDSSTDVLCWIIFSCGIFFLARRVVVRTVRSITTFSDFFMWIVALGPFVTGFLTIHAESGYKTLVICHILSVQIFLIVAPFTKFFHMVVFFFNRFLLPGELSFVPGRRTWT